MCIMEQPFNTGEGVEVTLFCDMENIFTCTSPHDHEKKSSHSVPGGAFAKEIYPNPTIVYNL